MRTSRTPALRPTNSFSLWVSIVSIIILGAAMWLAAGCSDSGLVSQNPTDPLSAKALDVTGAVLPVDGDWNGFIEAPVGEIGPDDDMMVNPGHTMALGSPPLFTTVIDFETPALGGQSSQLIDPFVDAVTGVVFTALGGGTVGLVKNNATSACVEPRDADQKLASGVGSTIGLSNFPIKAEFPTEQQVGTTVSVEVQAGLGARVQLRLKAASGATTGDFVQVDLDVPGGTCGYPGQQRSRKVVTLTSTKPFKFAEVSVTARFVYVMDDFSFSSPARFTLDIRPGSCPNPLNPAARGVLPVAITGADGADVSEIDLSTVRLAGVAPLRSNLADVAAQAADEPCACTTDGPDGFTDLTLKFSSQEIVATLGFIARSDERELTLTGELLDGTPFAITDCVRIVGQTAPRARYSSK